MIKRKIVLIFLITINAISLFSQPDRYIPKINIIGGKIIPSGKNLKNINPRITLGAELAIEFPSWREYSWQQYWGNPTLGLGVTYFNLGDDKVLGHALAVYPYLLIHCVDLPHFQLNYKFGGGMSFFNKTYSRCDTNPAHFYDATSNTIIGSIVNVYLTTGFNFNFPIKKGFAVHAELGYSHMSNGSIIQPNGGINMLYASIGTSYLINECVNYSKRYKPEFMNLPYVWSLNITASGGYRELYYQDKKGYGIASLHIGATYNICNWYALGGGLDMFYDGVFNKQGYSASMTPQEQEEHKVHTNFRRYWIDTENAANKFKFGVSINNEFKIGRITALLDWGIYLYDPIRLAYADKSGNKYTKRPIIYKYDIDKEDGWNYFRLGVRCRVWDNIYIQAAVKTHLSKAEMLEWGIGYQIPWKKKSSHEELSEGSNGYEIYHF